MIKKLRYLVLITTLSLVMLFSCKKDDAPPTAPTVTTAALTNITTTGATGGGTITSNGGATVTSSGIVWSKTNNTPTLADSVVSGATSSGSFTATITGLEFNTLYYIRAFATNSVGTSYGNVVSLNTTNDTSKVRFTYNSQTVTYGVIVSATTGKKWMDRNLGAFRVATSATDDQAYGDYFQWGRLADGHQLITSTTTTTLSSTDAPGNNNYIIPTANPDRDWRSPKNDNLWQGSTGINNPCPSGWHVPTSAEWQGESMADIAATFTKLKLPMAGYRSYLAATTTTGGGTQGLYWTSNTDGGVNSNCFNFSTTAPSVSGLRRGNACSIRCIKD